MNLFWSRGILIGFATHSLASVEPITYDGPKRVLLPSFSIVITPAPESLSLLAAQEIRDVAENLFEEYLSQFPWEVSSIYEYAGLSTVREILVNIDQDPPSTTIQVQGGVVAFAAGSTVVPSELEVVLMLQDSLNPNDQNHTSLTDQLNILGDFGHVQSTEFKVQQSIAPTFAPTTFIDFPSILPSSMLDERTFIPTDHPSLLTQTDYPSLSATPMPSSFNSDSPLPSNIPSIQLIEPTIQSSLTARPSFIIKNVPSIFPTIMPSQSPLSNDAPSLWMRGSDAPSQIDNVSPLLSVSSFSPTPFPSSRVFTSSTWSPSFTPSNFQTNIPTRAFSKNPTLFIFSTVQPSSTSAGKVYVVTALPTNIPSRFKPVTYSETPFITPSKYISNEPQPSLEPILTTEISTEYKPSSMKTFEPTTLNAGDSILKKTESRIPSTAPSSDNDLVSYNNSTTLNSNVESSNQSIVVVSCTLIGSIILSSLYALLVFRRRIDLHKVSNVGMKESMSDDWEDDALHTRDHLRGYCDEKSDSDSTFRHMLQTTASDNQLAASAFPSIQASPQSLENCTSFLDCGIEIRIIEKTSHENVNPEGMSCHEMFPACGSLIHKEEKTLEQSSLRVATFPYPVDLIDVTSDIKFNNWTDSSQSDGNEFTKIEDSDIDGIFSNENVWDFEDNCDDDEHTNPFTTPGYHDGGDKMLLLSELYLRSSSAS
jgi:hypothetical protein